MIGSQFFEIPLEHVVCHAVFVFVDHHPLLLLRGDVVLGGRVEGDRGSQFCLLQVLGNGFDDVVDVVLAVVVLLLVDFEVDLVPLLPVVVVEYVLLWNVVADLGVQHQPGLVGPAPRHVLDGVAAPSQQDHRQAKTFHEGQQLRVSSDGQIEMSEFVLGEGVSSALDDKHIGDIGVHHFLHYLSEELDVGHIGHAWFEGHVHCVVFAVVLADGVERACPREEVFVEFVETHRHNPVGVVEGLLHPVPVVDVNVEVEDSGVDLQQLQDAQDDVVHVAETTCFCFFAVVEASRPVNHDVALACDNQVGCVDAASGRQFAEIEEPFEAGAVEGLVDLEDGAQLDVFPGLGPLLLLGGGVLLDDGVGLGRYPGLEVLDVEGVVEGGQFLGGGFLGVVYFELWREGVVADEAVDHLGPLGLHGVLLAELVLGYILVVEVAHFPIHQLLI